MNSKTKGYIATAVFHIILILLLLWFGFSTPLPLPEEEGVEVNLGMDVKGFGKVQKPIAKTPPPPQKKTPPPPPAKKVEEDIATQDVEETIDVPEPKKKPEKKPEQKVEPETKPAPKEVKKEEKKPVLNPNALYKKKKGKDKAANQGNTSGQGDMGNPNGSKDSDSYKGNSKTGSGTTWSLSGRKARELRKPSNDFTEGGIVAVKIRVNQYGKVISAEYTPKGSTTTDSHLKKLAISAALKCKFNVDTNAPEVQQGTIYYNFKVGR